MNWFYHLLRRKKIKHLSLLFILLFALPFILYLAGKVQIFTPKAQDAWAQKAESLTRELLEFQEKGKVSEASLGRMVSVASARQEVLIELARNNPREFLGKAKLIKKRELFPQEVQEYIEYSLQETGDLRVRHGDDFKNKVSTFEYRLETPQKVYTLFHTQERGFIDEGKVAVSGVGIANYGVLPTESKSSLNYLQVQKVEIPESLNIGVILYKFRNTGDDPFTRESVETTMLGPKNSVKHYYEENSFRRMTVGAIILDWVTIPVDYDSDKQLCSTEEWENLADEEVKKLGFDKKQYNRMMYVTPYLAGCLYSGAATWTTTHINGNEDLGTYAHEIGHMVKMYHANSLFCPGKQIDAYDKCQSYEYGDDYDVMGDSSNVNQFNGPHKELPNYLLPLGLKVVEESGVYTLSTYEIGTGVQVIKIPRRYRYASESFYLEYRRPIGYDNSLPEKITEGVLVHVGDDDLISQTKLIDANPETDWINLQDAALEDGLEFVDSFNGISIKQLSHNSISATVEINFSPIERTPGLPLSLWKRAGRLPDIFNHTLLSRDKTIYDYGLEPFGDTSKPVFYRNTLASDGTLGSWVRESEFPELGYGQSFVLSNFLYVLGGVRQKDWKATNDVYYAPYRNNGSLGSWKKTTSLPESLYNQSSIGVGDFIYVLGGDNYHDSTLRREVYFTKIDGTGNLESWKKTTALPKDLSQPTTVHYKNFLYVLGGWSAETADFPETGERRRVYYTLINEDGSLGEWQETESLPEQILYNPVQVVSDIILVFGAAYSSEMIYYAKINSDGSLENWQFASDFTLPKKTYDDEVVLIGDRILFAGAAPSSQGYTSQVISGAKPTPTPTPILTPTPKPSPGPVGVGDIDRDGDIDIFDYNILVSHFGTRYPQEGSLADLDQDQDVDIFDYNIFIEAFKNRPR